MSITISGGGGVPGITVETDPTALKLTGGEILANNNGYALRIVQQGLGNVLEVYDQNGDPTPLVIDGNGNVGIGTTPSSSYKLNLSGNINIGGSVNASGSFAGAGANLVSFLQVGGQDIRNYVASYLFSGNPVTQTSQTITASIYWTDPNYATYTSGNNDDYGNVIPSPETGTAYYDVVWNGADFVSTLNNNSYTTGKVAEFYSSYYSMYVEVFNDEYGNLSYNPSSY
jgi:hypothetical protein